MRVFERGDRFLLIAYVAMLYKSFTFSFSWIIECQQQNLRRFADPFHLPPNSAAKRNLWACSMSPSAETSNGGGYKRVLELSNSFCFVSLLLSSFCLKPFLYIQRSYDPKKQCYDGFTAKFSFGWDSWDVISSTEPAASQVKSCASEIFLIQGFRFAKPHDLFASWPLIMSAELGPPWIATQKADHGRAVISII